MNVQNKMQNYDLFLLFFYLFFALRVSAEILLIRDPLWASLIVADQPTERERHHGRHEPPRFTI